MRVSKVCKPLPGGSCRSLKGRPDTGAVQGLFSASELRDDALDQIVRGAGKRRIYPAADATEPVCQSLDNRRNRLVFSYYAKDGARL